MTLKKEIEAGMVAHAFLFVGPGGSGKRTAAGIVARALLCQGADKPCNVCAACRQVQAQTHPDFLQMEVPEKSKARTIGVDDIRQLLKELSEKPYAGGRRVVIINDAHRMSVQAQNAFLKTLEEPPAGTVFLLLCQQEDAMLQTIRSRCRIIRMGRLTFDEMKAAFEKRNMQTGDLERLYDLSDGILGRAVEMASDAAFIAANELAVRILSSIKQPSDVARASAELSKLGKDEQMQFLDALEGNLRYVFVKKETDHGIFSGDDLAAGFTSPQLHSIIKEVISTRKRLDANVAFVSAAEPLLWAIYGRIE